MPKNNETTKREFTSNSGSCLLGRAYYLQLGLLERILKKEGLDKILRPGMCRVLFVLFSEDGQTISSIASQIRVAKSTMTGTVERLKANGLVKVKVDAKDRRAQRLSLTGKARTLEPALRSALDQLEDSLGGAMSVSEKKEFSRLLEMAVISMEADSNSD